VRKLVKKYPEIFYIRLLIFDMYHNVFFILDKVIRYYIRRIIHLLFVGTRSPVLWPYRGDLKNERARWIMAIANEL
jgi:hypothetical protein